MKELFDRHQERLSDPEDRRVWSTMFDATKRKQPFWKSWRTMSLIGTLGTAGLAIVLTSNLFMPWAGHHPGVSGIPGSGSEIAVRSNKPVERDMLARIPENEKLDRLQKEEGRVVRQDADDLDRIAGEPSEEVAAESPAALEKRHAPAYAQIARPHIVADQLAMAEGQEADPADGPAKDNTGSLGLTGGAVASRLAVDGKAKTAKVAVEPRGGIIRGRVTTDAGEPLRYANVELDGTRIGALSDSLGFFVIHDVPAGTYTVSASYLGFETAIVDISVEVGGDLELACTLAETPLAGDGEIFAMNEIEKKVLVFGGQVVVNLETADEASQTEGNDRYRVEQLADSDVKLPAKVAREKGKVDHSAEMVGGEGDTKHLAESSTSHRLGDMELKRLSAGESQESVSLKSGVVSQGGITLNFRSSDATYDSKGKPLPPRGDPIAIGGTDPVNGKAFDAMFFEHYGVNPFVDAEMDRFATFAVDVDNASYSLSRSYLNRGVLPPKEAIRVEEFINSFDHDYAPPRDEFVANREWAPSEQGTFAIHLDAAPSPFGNDLVLMRVGLKGREIHARDRKPATLTFVVDVSGSMNRENRLGLVKRALFMLLDQMNSEDEVALVVYGSEARVICPPTPLRDRYEIENAINRLRAEGSTFAEAGLRAGYAMAEKYYRPGRINRVILCSDGVANVGRTGAEDILRIIKSQTGKGIYLTAVGFGMGNYNDVLMEKLANQGDGNYYYVDNLDEAHKIFVENLTGTLQTIARDMKIQVEFAPGTVKQYRLLGYENRDVADRDFRNDKVDAGEVGAGHEVTALFELRLDSRSRRQEMATVRIRYEDPETGKVTEEARTIRVEDIAGRFESAEPTFRMDAAVAEFAEILRHSYWAKDGSLSEALGVARDASRELGRPKELEEMVGLVDTAWRLWPSAEKPRWNGDIRPQWEPEDDERR